MKKFSILAITLILALSACACGNIQDVQEQKSIEVAEAITAKDELGEAEMFRFIYHQDSIRGMSSMNVIEFIPNGSLFIITSSGDICPILDYSAYGAQPFDMDDLKFWLRN